MVWSTLSSIKNQNNNLPEEYTCAQLVPTWVNGLLSTSCDNISSSMLLLTSSEVRMCCKWIQHLWFVKAFLANIWPLAFSFAFVNSHVENILCMFWGLSPFHHTGTFITKVPVYGQFGSGTLSSLSGQPVLTTAVICDLT